MDFAKNTILTLMFGSVTFVQVVDVTTKIISVCLAAFVAWLQWRAYLERKKQSK